MTNNKGTTGMSRSEWLVDIGGWLVIAGLALEVVLALVFRDNERWYERWSLVLANAIIAGGVWLEIHFGGNVRAESYAREAEANERAESAKAEAAKANERILKMQTLRRLSKEHAEALTPLLKSELFQKEPKPSLRIGAVKDAEAQMYAMDFQRLLESCAVNIYPTDGGAPNEVIQLAPDPDGLVLRVKSKTNPNQAFAHFQHLVHSLGIAIPVHEEPAFRENEAMLTILRKPD
jgi:hypothetical protein